MPEIVNLTEEQRNKALAEADRRQSYNESRNLSGRNRAPAKGSKALNMHQLGAIGEMAAAVYFGVEDQVFSATTAVRNSSDLPGDIEVKTRSKHSYDLIVQKNERPDKKIVLVTVENNEVRVHGWCVAGDVMRQQFWADPARGRPAYFVPKRALNPLSTLELKADKEK
jgi:hypothetical protein